MYHLTVGLRHMSLMPEPEVSVSPEQVVGYVRRLRRWVGWATSSARRVSNVRRSLCTEAEIGMCLPTAEVRGCCIRI